MWGGGWEDVGRMWGGCGEDVGRMWGGCGEDVGRMWGGCGDSKDLNLCFWFTLRWFFNLIRGKERAPFCNLLPILSTLPT